MRKWILALAFIAVALGVLFATRVDRPASEDARPSGDRQAPSPGRNGGGDVEPAPAALSSHASAGMDTERKRKILNAASACARVDGFRATAAVLAGAASGDPLASLSQIQRQNLEKAERQCATDTAARTAPADEFLADLARGGNMAAAACYAYGGFGPKRHGVVPPLDAGYLKLVPKLIERGIAAGDWRMVALATSVNGPRRAGSPFTHLPPPDPELYYLYTKLRELGSAAEDKANLQEVLVELAKPLSPAARDRAQAMAESLFRAHFAQAPAYRHADQSLCVDF